MTNLNKNKQKKKKSNWPLTKGFFKILMITLISSKNLGGYKIMKHTVPEKETKIVNKIFLSYDILLPVYFEQFKS